MPPSGWAWWTGSSTPGALGYLRKPAARPEFLDAVRRTAAGDAVFTHGLTGDLEPGGAG